MPEQKAFLRPALDAYAPTLNKWTAEERVNTVGASDVGQCARKTYWVKNLGDRDIGASLDPEYHDNYGARLRGTMFEAVFWAPALQSIYGDRLLYSGEQQRTLVSGFLSATPDGLLTELTDDERALIAPDCGTEVMVECKTADPRTNLLEAKTENVFQTQVQLGLMRELTKYKPTHSILSYTNASFWDEGPEFIIAFDQQILDNAKKRATVIMTATSATELKPEGWIAGGRECEHCPFTKACGVTRRSVPDDVMIAGLDPQFVAEITDLARAIQQFENAIEFNTTRMRGMQDDLKTRLREAKLRKVPGVVTWTPVKGRSGWDNKAIREALEETGAVMDDFKTEGEPTDRLQILLKPATV